MKTDERIEVRKFVENAVAFCEEAGKEAAMAEIANKKGRFVHNGFYVYALDLGGTILAHPVEPELTGRNLIGLKDSNGKSFILKIIDVAKNKGYGFTDYKWHKPESKEELRKTVYFERIDGIVLCGGFYTTEQDYLVSLFKCFDYCGPM